MNQIVSEAKKIIAPSWPLQNFIAVNPFWNLKEHNSRDVFSFASGFLHQPLYMPLEYYLEKFEKGLIDESILSNSIFRIFFLKGMPTLSLDEFVMKTKAVRDDEPRYYTFAEFLNEDGWACFSVEQFSKLASGYFDKTQSLVHVSSDNGFWTWWKDILQFDKSLKLAGLGESGQFLSDLLEVNSDDAISLMLQRLAIGTRTSQESYIKRLLATVIGWASRFSHIEWEREKGKVTPWATTVSDCLCVRLVYDYLIYMHFGKDTELGRAWKSSYREGDNSEEEFKFDSLCREVWQDAMERTYQKKVISQIEVKSSELKNKKIQMAFCIDVRSEIIRRNIEAKNEGIETRGFAGFFGIPSSYQRCDHSKNEEMYPVLLSDLYEIIEKDKKSAPNSSFSKKDAQLILSFLRSLRKGALSSFAYVELFGCIAIERFIRRTYKFFSRKKIVEEVPSRFDCRFTEPALFNNSSLDSNSIQSLAKHLAQILCHMGISQDFSRLVVFTGHGSITTNNAYASSLDCGACGGHAGDINARFISRLLNQDSIRKELSTSHQIMIPEDTFFLAAIHETVTDQIYLLDKETAPESHRELIQELESTLKDASKLAQEERYHLRPVNIDHNPKRRSHNWSETRPEWGLAGNASFIVAPGFRVRGVNLEGRSFLHDYSWRNDSEFKTLELIMTAPMIVTNWINMQYYASTVAPDIYGSGNKTLHNVVNESGVFEGNGGDLRFGLPLQSVFDGDSFVHEPLRLSVFIEAPKDAIEDIISRHEMVKNLVENEWMHIFQIEDSGMVNKRVPKKLSMKNSYRAEMI